MKNLLKILSIALFVAANANGQNISFRQRCKNKNGTPVPLKAPIYSKKTCTSYGGKVSKDGKHCLYYNYGSCTIGKGSYQMQRTGRGTEMTLMKYPANASATELVNAIKVGLPKNHQSLIKLNSKYSNKKSVTVNYGANKANTSRYSLLYLNKGKHWTFDEVEISHNII